MLTSLRFSICTLGILYGSLALGAERIKPIHVRELAIPADVMSGAEQDRRYLFSPDGKFLLFGYRYDSQVQIWDVGSGKRLGTIASGFRGNNWAAAFAPDGRLIATTDLDHYGASTVDLWDIESLKKNRNLDEDVNVVPFACVAFSPDGKSLALGAGAHPRSRNADLAIHVWNASSGLETRQLAIELGGEDPLAIRRPPLVGVEGLAYAPDGKTLAVISQNKIHLLELLTGKERGLLGTFATLHQKPTLAASCVRHASFSPDGRYFGLLTSDGVLRLWDTGLSRPLSPLYLNAELVGTIHAFHFSPDAPTLRTFAGGGTLATWKLHDFSTPAALSAEPDEAALQRHWNDLASDKRHKVMDAVLTLSASPQTAFPFLEARLQPAPTVDPRYLERLIRDLQQSDFNARKRAAAELRHCGELALPALLQAQENRFDDLTRKLIDKLAAQFPTAEQVRQTHALQILEAWNTPQARAVLERLAEGPTAAMLTREARKTLERMPRAIPSSSAALSLESRCAELGNADAALAFEAMLDLVRNPEEALVHLRPRLQAHVRTAPDDSAERIAALLSQLDDADYAVRDKALSQLGRIGPAIEPAVRRALAESASLEQQNRLDRLLRQFVSPQLTPSVLELQRGIEVLERIGGASARRLLADLRETCKNRVLQSTLDAALVRLGK
jgi:hypothetical protein